MSEENLFSRSPGIKTIINTLHQHSAGSDATQLVSKFPIFVVFMALFSKIQFWEYVSVYVSLKSATITFNLGIFYLLYSLVDTNCHKMVKCGHIDKLFDNDIFKQAHYTTQCRWLTNCRQWAVLMADGTK